MKGFYRFTAITLSLAMIIASMFTVGVFADAVTFTDVTAETQYNQAIYSLVSKGIINGYTEADGTSTFKPDNTITRAEFAKLLVLATTTGVTHTATTNKFPDLALDHWANTYIAAAVNTGAINGYDDGTFKPENPVSYGEAVKMIVCTLGYASIVTPTEPWYDGYIKVANSIGLTRGAAGLGSNEAKRGLVAQLIYNISSSKQLVQTGTDASGRPSYSSKSNDEDLEEVIGIVTAVFETTIEGVSYDLNKEQMMIDDEVYYIGEYTVEELLPYLGKSVSVDYEDGSKKTIVELEESKNKTLTVDAADIDTVNGREITYFEDDEEEELTLASDLYVIFNGRGVEQELIDDDFIEEYLDVDSGEITFLNNDGKSDYDVAFVTSYQTMFVTGKSGTDGVYKIFDNYGPVKEITLKDNDCTVYRVASKGGKKTEVDSLSSIPTSNAVLSIAAPLDQTDGTEVVISAVKLTGKQVESVSKYDYTIDGDEYQLSAYYEDLIESDSSKYELSKGDAGTFYFDFFGKLVYYTKSETTDPYGYLASIDHSGSGLSGNNYTAYIFTQTGSWLKEYPLSENIKVNGDRCDPSEAVDILEETAALINADKPDEMIENAEVSQLIKYKTKSENGQTCISEIYTIDPDGDYENGDIVPGSFIGDPDKETEATPFSKGVKLQYNSSSKVFKDTNDGSQFMINSSTIIFSVPYDRGSDLDDYRKGSFSDQRKYIVEPYDVSSKTAKVVVAYVTEDETNATIYSTTKPVFIESISNTTNNNGEDVEKIVYYTAGTDTKEDYDERPAINTKKGLSLEDLGIGTGDIVKFAVEGTGENAKVVGVQKVFVGGKLYDWDSDDVFETTESETNVITHPNKSDTDYYEVIYGKAYSKSEAGDNLAIIPLGGDDWKPYTVSSSSTKFYKLIDRNKTKEFNSDGVTIYDISTIEGSSEANATEVVAIKMGSNLIAVYIVE